MKDKDMYDQKMSWNLTPHFPQDEMPQAQKWGTVLTP